MGPGFYLLAGLLAGPQEEYQAYLDCVRARQTTWEWYVGGSGASLRAYESLASPVAVYLSPGEPLTRLEAADRSGSLFVVTAGNRKGYVLRNEVVLVQEPPRDTGSSTQCPQPNGLPSDHMRLGIPRLPWSPQDPTPQDLKDLEVDDPDSGTGP